MLKFPLECNNDERFHCLIETLFLYLDRVITFAEKREKQHFGGFWCMTNTLNSCFGLLTMTFGYISLAFICFYTIQFSLLFQSRIKFTAYAR